MYEATCKACTVLSCCFRRALISSSCSAFSSTICLCKAVTLASAAFIDSSTAVSGPLLRSCANTQLKKRRQGWAEGEEEGHHRSQLLVVIVPHSSQLLHVARLYGSKLVFQAANCNARGGAGRREGGT